MKAKNLIPVFDHRNKVIARVQYNDCLDFWDGHNMTCGPVGLHMGYTRLRKSGAFVLINGTQWQGRRDYGEIISPRELIQEALRTGHIDEVLSKYPDLRAVYSKDIEI